jgi:hypothetical protein
MNVDGKPAKPRGPADQLPDPAAETQYLHYKFDESRLRYATDIGKEELLKHDGDVAISVALSQYRPGNGETHMRASQLRVDTTQIHPLDRFTYAKQEHGQDSTAGSTGLSLASGNTRDKQDSTDAGSGHDGGQHL